MGSAVNRAMVAAVALWVASGFVLRTRLRAGWCRRLCSGSTAGAGGCSGGTRSIEEAAKHEVVMISWFTGRMKQDHREENAR